VDADSIEQFELSFKRIAETLHLRPPGSHMRAGEELTEEVYQALKRNINSPWLLILDGLRDEETLQGRDGSNDEMRKLLDSIPKPPLARVLVTTRSRALAMSLVNQKDDHVVDIPALKDEDAALVLLGKISSDAAKVNRATSVSRILGGSAGALTFAHLYRRVVDKHCSWRQYMERIHPSPTSTGGTGTTALVVRAWQLLYESLREKHRETASLLRFIGMLDVQSIPTGFFSKSEFANHVRRLIKYGMVEPTADQRVLRVTAIVRHCLQIFLKETGEQDLFLVEQVRVLSLMCDKFEEKDPDRAELLLPMVLATLKFQPTSQEAKGLLATLLFRVAHHYAHTGRPQKGMQYLEQCLNLRKQDPERQNRNLIQETERAIEDARNQLSTPKTEKTAQAKSDPDKGTVVAVAGLNTYRLGQELKQLEQSDGADHADTIRKVSELAAATLTTHDSDRSESQDDAAALYQRVLAWCKKNHGDNNMDTARLQYNLALAREAKGEYDEAEALYLSASQTVEQHLGPGNPELLRILRSLAFLLCRLRNLGAATQVLVAVLHGQDNALGYNHPETLVTRQNIAMLLEEKGQVDAAGGELERVVGVQSYLLGRDDPATLQTACSLAMNYRLRGRPEDAEMLFRATLGTQRKTLGKNHRDTVTTDLMLRELLQSKTRDGE
jgi:tetratricopeptide (TPR) repeat protein